MAPNRRSVVVAIGLACGLPGCVPLKSLLVDPVPSGDTGTEITTSDTTPTDSATHTGEPRDGLSVVGQLLDVDRQGIGPEGACVSLLDPTPVLLGMPPEVIATAVSTKGGAYAMNGVPTDSKVGLWIAVDDCQNSVEDDLFPTRTNLIPSQYSLLGDGDTLEVAAFTILHEFVTLLDADLTKWTKSPSTMAASGFIWGFALDDLGTPLDDILVACPTCIPSPTDLLYVDADPADGLFTTNGTPNGTTDAGADGAWMVLGPSIGAYTATDTQGQSSFDDLLVVAQEPGLAFIVAFFAQPVSSPGRPPAP